MAPLPENSTKRLWVDYIVGGQAHSLQFRGLTSASSTIMLNRINAFLDALLPICYANVSFTGARFANAGQDISLPLFFAPKDGALAGNIQPIDAPRFIGYSGRGQTTGRRTNLRIFGTNVTTDPTYRAEPPLTGALATAYTILENATTELCTIGGDSILWKPYVNLGYDAYYQRKARTG